MGRLSKKPDQANSTIALYVVACLSACALFGFGFYTMLQPRHIPNLGLAAYKPFPATVTDLTGSNKLIYPTEPAATDMADASSDETTGRARELAQPAPPVSPLPAHQGGTQAETGSAKKQFAERPARARIAAAKRREPALQRPEHGVFSRVEAESRSLAAAFPGYAAIH